MTYRNSFAAHCILTQTLTTLTLAVQTFEQLQ